MFGFAISSVQLGWRTKTKSIKVFDSTSAVWRASCAALSELGLSGENCHPINSGSLPRKLPLAVWRTEDRCRSARSNSCWI